MGSKKKKGLVNLLVERGKAETPEFFKRLQMAGVIMTAVGGAVLGSPFALPAVVMTIAGYFVVTGSVVTAVCQVAVPEAHEAESAE